MSLSEHGDGTSHTNLYSAALPFEPGLTCRKTDKEGNAPIAKEMLRRLLSPRSPLGSQRSGESREEGRPEAPSR